ncbi:hypothetical protein [Janthinobacterium sp. PC23-8]|uniref:hypothetical protein n=1 Tax=Janthinobacterium sp. PC23-8 TaxID=2012679 RepID=UPI00113FEAD5|nr:hypothetical protein [Janthinobacterium sp. PC23-8]
MLRATFSPVAAAAVTVSLITACLPVTGNAATDLNGSNNTTSMHGQVPVQNTPAPATCKSAIMAAVYF